MKQVIPVKQAEKAKKIYRRDEKDQDRPVMATIPEIGFTTHEDVSIAILWRR